MLAALVSTALVHPWLSEGLFAVAAQLSVAAPGKSRAFFHSCLPPATISTTQPHFKHLARVQVLAEPSHGE